MTITQGYAGAIGGVYVICIWGVTQMGVDMMGVDIWYKNIAPDIPKSIQFDKPMHIKEFSGLNIVEGLPFFHKN